MQARIEADRLRGDIARGKDPDAERRLVRAYRLVVTLDDGSQHSVDFSLR